MSKSQQLARVPYTTLFRSEAPLEVTATVNNHDQGPVNLDWGEGDPVEVEDGEDATHTYEEAGEHTITATDTRSEEHTSELQSRGHLVCRLLLEKKKHKDSG